MLPPYCLVPTFPFTCNGAASRAHKRIHQPQGTVSPCASRHSDTAQSLLGTPPHTSSKTPALFPFRERKAHALPGVLHIPHRSTGLQLRVSLVRLLCNVDVPCLSLPLNYIHYTKASALACQVLFCPGCIILFAHGCIAYALSIACFTVPAPRCNSVHRVTVSAFA
jgi:hypothetical protein